MDADAVLCPVCLIEPRDLQEDALGSLMMVVTRCHHKYCANCFDNWQNIAPICAVCRSELIETRRYRYSKSAMSPDAPAYVPSQNTGVTQEPSFRLSHVTFNLRVTEKHEGVAFFEQTQRKPRKLPYSIFDLVVESNTLSPIILERYIGLPMGGMEQLHPYFEWLFLNAADVVYESSLCRTKHDCTAHVARRIHRLNIQHASARNRNCIYKRLACWSKYKTDVQ